MSEEDNLGQSVENLFDATSDLIESGQAADVAAGLADRAANALQGAVDTTTATLNAIDPKDLTAESLREAFNTNGGVDGITAQLVAAGFNASKGAVEAIYNKAANGSEYADILNHFRNAGKPPAENQDLMAMLMSGDLSGIPSLIEGKIGGFIESLTGFKDMASNFGGDIGNMITGLLDQALGLLNGFGGQIGGMLSGILPGGGQLAENDTAAEDTTLVVADTSVDTSVQPGTGELERASEALNQNFASTDTAVTDNGPAPDSTPRVS